MKKYLYLIVLFLLFSAAKGLGQCVEITSPASPTSICEGGSVSLTGVISDPAYTSFTWSSDPATGVFSDPASLTTDWTPPAGTGSFTITLEAFDVSCGPKTASVIINVVADPSWSGYSFPVTDICEGGSVSFDVSVDGGLGGTLEWIRSAESGGAGIAVPSPDIPPSAGTYYYRPHYTPTGDGCALADGTETAVTVVADPSWSGYSFPVTDICEGGSLSFDVSVDGGLGGTLEWIRSAESGGAGIAVTSPDMPPLAGTYYYRPHYTPTGDGCALADGTETTVTVVADPSWSGYSFPVTDICEGGSLSFDVSVDGGLGGTLEWIRSAESGGAGIAVTSPDMPPLAGTYYYRPHYTPTGDGCALADGTETTVTVVAGPSWSGYSFPVTDICEGGSVSFDVSVDGGLGGTLEWIRSAESGGAGIAVTSPDIPPSAGTYYYRPHYTPTGDGCALADGTETAVTVVADPSWSGYSFPVTDICEGGSVSFDVSVDGGLGGTLEWMRSAESGGAGIAVTSPDIPPSAGTYYYRPHYIPSGGGCSLSDGTETVVSVSEDPEITVQPLSPPPICAGSTTTDMTVTATGGTPFLTYRWQYNNGGVWDDVTNGMPAGAVYSGASGNTFSVSGINVAAIYQYRCAVSATGLDCAEVQSDPVNVTVNSLPTLASAYQQAPVCSGSKATINLTGLLSGSVSEIHYTINSVPYTANGITEIGGNGSFETEIELPASLNGKILHITDIRNTLTGCSSVCSVSDIVLLVNTASIPVITPGDPTPCINQAGNIYTTEAGMTNYAWEWSPGGTETSSTTNDNSITMTWTASGPQWVKVTYDNLSGCSSSNTLNFNVSELPVPTFTSGPVSVCDESEGIYTTQTGKFNYDWTVPAGGTIVAGGDGSNMVVIRWTVPGTHNVSVNYENEAGCPAALPAGLDVTVNAIPSLSSPLSPGGICSGNAITYTPESTVLPATYSWTRSEVPGIAPASSSGTGGINEILTNSTTTPVNVSYRYIVTANGCNSSVQDVTVTVNPIPQLSSSLSPLPVCSGTPFSYTPASQTTSTSFSWIMPPVPGISGGAGSGTGSINETLTSTNTNPTDVTYTYTTMANGCSSDQDVVVTVNPRPVLATTLSPDAICSGTTFTYTPSSATAGTSFEWSRASVAGILQTANSGTGAINETLTNTTSSPVNVTYVYTLNANGCTTTQGVSVQSEPLPLPAIAGPADVLLASSHSYSTAAGMSGYVWNVTAGGTISASPDPNVINILWTTPGDKTVTLNYTNAFGCTAVSPSAYNVHVNAKPVASQIAILGQARSGMTLNASYTYYDAEGDNEGTSAYQWYTGTSPGGAGAVPVAGATSTSYLIPDADIGKYIGFSVTPAALTGSTPGNIATSVTWAGPVINDAPVATVSDITGSLDVNGVLTGHYVYTDTENDIESGSAYKWYRSATFAGTYTEIPLETGISHVITMPEQGMYFKFSVRPKALTGTHSGTEKLSPAYGPANTMPYADNVLISGIDELGSVLTGSYQYHDNDGDPEGTSLFRWLRNGSEPVPGADGLTYTLTEEDEGYTITFEVTPVSSSGYPEMGTPVTSDPTVPVIDPSPLEPAALGVCIEGIRKEGGILRGKYEYSFYKQEGISQYQWYRDGVPVTGATSVTYILSQDDIDSNADITFSVVPRSSNVPSKEGPIVISEPLARIILPKDEFGTAEPSFILETNEPAPAGIFSGPGVSNGIFSPAAAGAEESPHIINYLLNYVNVSHICSQQVTDTVVVNPNVAFFTGFESVYCHDSEPGLISVSNVPAGATFRKFESTAADTTIISSTESTFSFDPGKMRPGFGRDTLSFSYWNEGIFYKISQAFNIDSVGTGIRIINLDSAYCEGDLREYISVEGVYPTGGTATWTGDFLTIINLSSAYADPSLGTPGETYPYSYRYKSPSGCFSRQISGRVKLNHLPDPGFALDPTYNVDGGSVTLTPVQTGGIFTGDGISGSTLFPDIAGVGPHMISYSITDENNCTAGLDLVTTIRKAQGTFNGIPSVICYTDTTYTVTVTGLPVSGTGGFNFTNTKNTIIYTPGTATALYNVPAAGEGNDLLTFSYTWDGVPYSITKDLVIDRLDSIIIRGINPGDTICTHEGRRELIPSVYGGIFTGPVTGGFLDPVKGERLDTIVYTYTNIGTGCSTTTKVPLSIFPSPVISFAPIDTCISDDSDPTVFENTTSSEDRIESWLWKFTDEGATHEYRDSVGIWLYKSGGLQKISLTATTESGCTVTKEDTYNIGKKPVADFYWKNDCMHEGDSIILVDTTFFTTPVISRSWKVYGGDQFDTVRIAKYPKFNTGYVNIELTVNTAYANCSSSIIKSIYVRPTISADSYFEDFEDGAGGWTKDHSEVNTWEFGTPDRNFINSAFSGDNAWFTGFTDITQVESSAIESPCFDFSNAVRPVIKLNLWKRFEKDRDGSVLQYKTANDSEWQNVGTINDGIEWYNSAAISGEPGDVRVGWTTAGTPDICWKESVHTLDELTGKTDVKFRIAYGTKGSYFNHDGMAFDDIWIGERGRKVLIEHFTNAFDPESLSADELLNVISGNKNQDLINIQYHTNFPGNDPFYARNPGDVSARVLFYGLIKTPYTFVDGGTKTNFASIFDNDIAKIDSNEMTRRSLIPSPFRMMIETSVSGDILNVKGRIIPLQDLESDNLMLFVAVTEKQNSVGETEYRNIFRKFLPDAGGIILQNTMKKGDIIEFPEQSWMIRDISGDSDIEVIAFIQNVNSREIYQAVSSVESDIIVGINDNPANQLRMFSVYPNPARNNMTVSFEEELQSDAEIKIFNVQGEIIRSYKAGRGTTEYRIDDAGLKGGLYLIRVVAGRRDLGYVKLIVTED